MKTFCVSYKLYGTITVKANNKKEAEKKIGRSSNQELLDGCDMDGDSIEVYDVEEVE